MCVGVYHMYVHHIFSTYRYMRTFVDNSDPVFMYINMYVLYTCVSMYTCKYIYIIHVYSYNMYAYTCLDGAGNMSEIPDYMNYKPNNAIGLKYHLLKTIIYRTFAMEPIVN